MLAQAPVMGNKNPRRATGQGPLFVRRSSHDLPTQPIDKKNLIGNGPVLGYFIGHMGSLKKRRKAKINKHKRRKKLRLNRHKKRTWQK